MNVVTFTPRFKLCAAAGMVRIESTAPDGSRGLKARRVSSDCSAYLFVSEIPAGYFLDSEVLDVSVRMGGLNDTAPGWSRGVLTVSPGSYQGYSPYVLYYKRPGLPEGDSVVVGMISTDVLGGS